jgi:small GTP-binding protein
VFGRRNVGKSSILNALTRQSVSIVSDVAGTTTDPVEKPMELQPLGPVVFIDTAGVDDGGDLGALRVERTIKVIERTDVAILVAAAGAWGEFERGLLDRFRGGDGDRRTPVIVAFNQDDLGAPSAGVTAALDLAGVPWVRTVATRGDGVGGLREAIVRVVPQDLIEAPPLLADLVRPGEVVVLVVPIDR